MQKREYQFLGVAGHINALNTSIAHPHHSISETARRFRSLCTNDIDENLLRCTSCVTITSVKPRSCNFVSRSMTMAPFTESKSPLHAQNASDERVAQQTLTSVHPIITNQGGSRWRARLSLVAARHLTTAPGSDLIVCRDRLWSTTLRGCAIAIIARHSLDFCTFRTLCTLRRSEFSRENHRHLDVLLRRQRREKIERLKHKAHFLESDFCQQRVARSICYSCRIARQRFTAQHAHNRTHVLWPQRNISPLVGLSIVPIRLSIVVLPPPDVPKITTNSPCLIVKLTPLRGGNQKQTCQICHREPAISFSKLLRQTNRENNESNLTHTNAPQRRNAFHTQQVRLVHIFHRNNNAFILVQHIGIFQTHIYRKTTTSWCNSSLTNAHSSRIAPPYTSVTFLSRAAILLSCDSSAHPRLLPENLLTVLAAIRDHSICHSGAIKQPLQ